jgi:hypothetical protein
MRILIAACALFAFVPCAAAKDWGQMSGHERRLYVISYIKANDLRCSEAPGSIADQESRLSWVPWLVVRGGLGSYCVKERHAPVNVEGNDEREGQKAGSVGPVHSKKVSAQ